jgi:DNA modification methylase
MKPYYDSGGITIYHGDCLEVLPQLEQVDHVITDPPYGRDIYLRMRNQDSAGGNRRHKIKGEDSLIAMRAGAIGSIDDLLIPSSVEMALLTKRWALVFSDVENCHRWRDGMEAGGHRYVRTGAWIKPDAMPQMTGDRPGVGFEPCTITHAQGRMRWNGGGYQALWTHNIVKGDERPDHPCPKPLSLMRQLVEQFTDPDELILDPFMGSGTTLRAAKDLGRRAIGIEIEEKYCEIAVKRLAQEVLL